MQIIAKVVANCAGLARALNSNDFRDFAAGFTQGNAAFDFVDVGNGKERRADSKIRGMLYFFPLHVPALVLVSC